MLISAGSWSKNRKLDSQRRKVKKRMKGRKSSRIIFIKISKILLKVKKISTTTRWASSNQKNLRILLQKKKELNIMMIRKRETCSMSNSLEIYSSTDPWTLQSWEYAVDNYSVNSLKVTANMSTNLIKLRKLSMRIILMHWWPCLNKLAKRCKKSTSLIKKKLITLN